jgi:hypothetical protein
MDEALARQVVGQGPPGRLAALEGVDRRGRSALSVRRDRRSLELGRALLQLLERERELLEPGAALRGRAEALVPELGDAELELLDLKLERDAHRLGLRGFGEGGLRAPLGEGNLLG